MNKEPIVIEEPVHDFFELSYASYLVLPRSVLQSMPIPWQKKFVKLMNQADKLIGGFPDNGYYTVYLRDEKGRFIKDTLADYERGRRRLHYKTNEEAKKTFRDILH
jgi:hypothetical protein